MATFFVNGVLPVEVLAGGAYQFLQVVAGTAFIVEGESADPKVGIQMSGETKLFNKLVGPITALNANPSGYCVIRTTDPTQIETADGATAGTPGVWTLTPKLAPLRFPELAAIPVIATPLTTWTAGQFMVMGDGTSAYWDGTAWQQGIAS